MSADHDAHVPSPATRSAEEMRRWLVRKVARVAQIPENDIDVHAPFATFGLSSMQAIELSGEIETWLGREVSPLLVYEHPSISALSEQLADPVPAPAPPSVAHSTPSVQPIAVIGMACRFPGANDPEAFWELLETGRDAVADIPADRWNVDAFYDARPGQPGRMQTRWGGFIDDVDCFDAGFFGISRREASQMDPQQRVLLEVAWEALENAGEAPDTLAGSSTGVFIGVSSSDSLVLRSSDATPVDIYAATGNSHAVAANRLSYLLDLRGPSIAVDTACSSSLVAVDLAFMNLRLGRCDTALAGGVNVVLAPHGTVAFSQMGAMAVDGRCKAFDADADGYVRSEGAGIVVLKRLDDAVRDGNRILAVLRGSAVNQDGRTNGLTAPNGLSQQAVIRLALASAGVAASEVSYVEAHGTGTPLGDPIEFHSLVSVLNENRPTDAVCYVGSAKTNIGHLEAAAGVASLIKVVLALQHRQIPPHVHFKTLNREIQTTAPFHISTRLAPWPQPGGGSRVASVSSFGFGGTNAHVIVSEGVDASPRVEEVSRPRHVLTLSAPQESALGDLARRYRSWLGVHRDASLLDVCFTANTGRSHFRHRLALVAADIDALDAELEHFLEGGRSAKDGSTARHREAPKVAFLFPGQGCQYQAMGAALYGSQPTFRKAFDGYAALARPYLDRPLASLLFDDDAPTALLNRPLYAQTSLFVIGLSLADLWRSWGVEPDAVLGHSAGEYAAACVAGAFGPEDGLKLIAERARVMDLLPAGGAMAAVFADAADVEPFLAGHDRVSIAARNSPQNTVISGAQRDVQAILERLAGDGLDSTLLDIPLSSHSPLVDPVLDDFEASIGGVRFESPAVLIASTLTGRCFEAGEVPSARYWRDHLRQPVEFARASRALLDRGIEIFVELGPAALLSKVGAIGFPEAGAAWLPSLKKDSDDWDTILSSLATLYERGYEVDWAGFDHDYATSRLALPTYPFARDVFPRKLAELPTSQDALPEAIVSSNAPEPRAPVKMPRVDRLTARLCDMVAALLDEDVRKIDRSMPLLMMGADSITLTRALQNVQSEYGVKISARQIFGELNTIDRLAQHIDDHMPPEAMPGPELGPTAPVPSATTSAPAASIPTASTTTPLAPLASETSSVPDSPIERLMAEQLKAVQQVVADQLAFLTRNGLAGAASGAGAATAEPARAASASAPAPAPAAPVSGAAPSPPAARAQASRLPVLEQAARAADTPVFALSGPRELDTAPSSERDLYLAAFIRRYCEHTRRSKALARANQAHADFRDSVRFSLKTKELVYPVAVDRSIGSKFWDVDGNELVDWTMGFGVNLFGHSPDFIVRAIEEQLQQGMSLGPLCDLTNEVARLLSELTGCERVAFANTGTEAVMAAVRVARTTTSRPKIVMFAGSYHGGSDGLLAMPDPTAGDGRAMAATAGVPDAMVQNTVLLEYGSPEALEFIAAHGHEIAGVLVEPVQSRRPSFQPRTFLHELRRITRESGTALIFDECVTGFRIDPGGAQAFFDVRADLVIYGKILGGGLPIGVVAGARRFMDAVDGGAWTEGDNSYPERVKTFVSGTFSKHPLAMAAARAVLLRLTSEGTALHARLNERTARLAADVNGVLDRARLPFQIEHCGSLFRFVFPTKLGRSIDVDLFFYHLSYHGVYIWEGRTCFLSTAHTDADIRQFVAAVEKSIAELTSGGYLTASAPAPGAGAVQFPLTEAQEQLWVLTQLGRAGFEPLALELAGDLDLPALRRAFQDVTRRHEALRTLFSANGDFQRVLPEWTIEIPLVNLAASDPARRAQEAAALVEREAGQPFDLATAPPWRVTVVRLEADRHLLVLTAHHIILDGWSSIVLLREVFSYYAAAVTGTSIELPTPLQFREYTEWTRRRLASDELTADEAYWLDRLSGPLPTLDLPADHPRPRVKSYKGGRETSRLDARLFDSLKAIARAESCTPFMVLLAAYGVLLHRLTEQDELVVGFSVNGRFMERSENMVGYCNHVVPLRLGVDDALPFSMFLDRCKAQLLEAYDHQEYPFARLINRLNPDRDPSRPPIVTTTFNLEPPVAWDGAAGLAIDLAPSAIGFTGGDLHLNVTELKDGAITHIDYDRDLFDPQTIRRMLDQYRVLLEGIVQDRQQRLWALPILTDAERRVLQPDWSGTHAS